MQEANFQKQLYHDAKGEEEKIDIYILMIKVLLNKQKIPIHHQRSKTIDVKYHYIRSQIQCYNTNEERDIYSK